MSIRFEILLNGKRLCTSGIEGNGVLSNTLTYVRREGEEEGQCGVGVGGLGHYHPHDERQHHVNWCHESLNVGDEITFRILPPGEFDPPANMEPTPRIERDEPTFGNIQFSIDSWLGELPMEHELFDSIRIRILASHDGPTPEQQTLYKTLIDEYDVLWPSIATALLDCHEGLKDIDDLRNKIKPRVVLNIEREAESLLLIYEFENEPTYNGYNVRIRSGKIVEMYMVE